MRCKSCGHKYSVAYGQPAPGGSSAPGVFFIISIILFSAGIILAFTEYRIWMWISFGVGIFVAIQVLFAWGDCATEMYSGADCPSCKHHNRVYPWSL